jgi:hypothetical protein
MKKKNLFLQLERLAETRPLKGEDYLEIKGGFSIDIGHSHINLGNCHIQNETCNRNACDPTNTGACAGNTLGGAPSTCPLSL